MSNLRISISSSLSSLNFSALYSRFFLVSHPCTVLASAQKKEELELYISSLKAEENKNTTKRQAIISNITSNP